MAVERKYMPRVGTTPSISPAFGSQWDITTSADRVVLIDTSSGGDASNLTISRSETSTSIINRLIRQYVSATPLTAQTLSGSFTLVMQGNESNSGANSFMQCVVRVVDSTGATERGVLYAGQILNTADASASAINGEFTTATQTRAMTGVALTPLAVSAGDLLVVEVGYRTTNTSATSLDGSLRVGAVNAQSDLANSPGSTTDGRPWIEFTFADPAASLSIAGSLQRKTAVFTTFAGASATLSADLQRKTAAFTTFAGASVALSADLQRKTAAVTLDAHPVATLAGDLQRKTAAITLNAADAIAEISLAGTLQRKISSVALDAGPVLSLAGDLQRKTSVFTLDLPAVVTLTGDLQRKTAAFELSSLERPIRISATLRRKTASITLKIPPYILLAGTLRPKTAAFALVKPPQTDFTNTAASFTINGYGVATWTPLVVEPPEVLIHDYEVAIAFSTPTLDNGRPIYTVTEARTKRARDRILVGGVDVTFYRDVRTPTPDYRLVSPLRYGAGTLVIPAINANFETPGEGALAFCGKDKPVIVQRVDPDTGEVVADDDYRGFIDSWDCDGTTWTFALGGEVTGRMANRWHPQPPFKAISEAGHMVAHEVRRNVIAPFTPLLGEETGIRLHTWGAQFDNDHFSELLAKMGGNWTVGRRDDGTWGMWEKDRTTIHATIYFDNGRMVPSLHRAFSEEPNRVFATGVTKDGQRITFNVYPGLVQGDAPDYPFDNNAAFSAGTTDDDTDRGDGITVMIHRLVVMGYLSVEDGAAFTYDADVTAAIRNLQDDAGLTESGMMNPATWRALYDLGATGYSLAGAGTLPAAQRSYTRQWLREASGALSERNPNFDPHRIIRDAVFDMGPGFTAQQIKQWARDELGTTEGDWTGTATCHLALVRGEHNPGDVLPEADVMTAREIQPGMNVWAPLFNGGTLFHVSGVSVSGNGRDVELTLDTKARDTMKAWEVITQARESKRSSARIWLNQYRSSTVSKDALEPWDARLGGRIDKVTLHAGWNHFPFVAGQAGTMEKMRLETNPPTEFVASLSGREISDDRMAHLIGNPLTEAGTDRWEAEWVQTALRSRVWLESWGQHDQPCGYYPRQKTGDDGDATGAPLTGVMVDTGGVGFHTFAQPVLWLAVYVPTACTIPAGRIAWLQGESGA